MKRILFSVPLMLVTLTVCAQDRWYANGGIGMMNYFGDLQERQITLNQLSFGATAGLTYVPSNHWSANFAVSYGSVKASDSKNGQKWFYRNLSFQTNLVEVAGTVQYDLFPIDLLSEDDDEGRGPKRITPYIFAGVGAVHFNPYTYDQAGKKVYLQPLGTEGQITPYSLWTITFPMGIGVKYSLSRKIVLSGDFDLRKTLTDYMDDVSIHQYADTALLLARRGQESASLSYRADEIPNSPYKFYGYRGNPNKKDGFYTFTIRISYLIFERPKFYIGY